MYLIRFLTKVGLPVFLISAGFSTIGASNNPMMQVADIKQKSDIFVKGTVVDQDGQPLIGASIKVEGSQVGVTTDFDGAFSLQCPMGSTLEIAYIGYNPIKVKAEPSLSVTLTENRHILDEVVVVGYGTQRREELTSSVSSVKSESFVQSSNPDAASLIRGKVPGLAIINTSSDPMATAQISLRGTTTLKSSSSPLVLIDGIPGEINEVSPNDIEQIDVLKDGSAAAIYGTRGTNGVILITTKRNGTEGRTSVDINMYWSIQKVSRKLDMLSSNAYRELSKQGVQGAIDYGSSTDWMDQILQTPFNQTYSVALRGGSSNGKYVAAIDYTKNEGIVKHSDVNVLYPRLYVEQKMFRGKLKLEAQLSGYNRTYETGFNTNVYNSALIYNPTAPIKNQDGSWYEGASSSQWWNPVALLEETKGDNKHTKLRMYGKATIYPFDGLSISILGSKDISNWAGLGYETQKHNSTTMSGYGGVAKRTSTRTQDDMLEILANYSRNFGAHSLNALAGYTWDKYNYQYAYMYNFGFSADDFTYNNMGNGTALSKGKASMSTSQNESKLVGYFGRLNYNFANKYFLSASIRYEGSSKFGKDHKWGTFPAVSAGWTISRESFMKGIDWLNNLKLRVGYGITGTMPGNPYMSLTTLSFRGQSYYNGAYITMMMPGGNANPDLRWEKKKEFNVGLDFSFLNDRISGTVDYYRRRTEDLIWDYSVPVPPFISTSITANAGTIDNSGLEIGLTFIPVQNHDFDWTSSINFSTNKNKLVSLSNDKFVSGSYFDNGFLDAPIQQSTHRAEEGGPIGNFYGYKSIGVDNDGRWIIEGADGQPKSIAEQKPEDKQVIGNGVPKYYLNFNNTLRYKNIDFSVTMRGAFKFDVLNTPAMFYGTPVSIANANTLSNAFDAKFYGKALSSQQELQYVSYFVEKGDYWKIDNVTIGWSPKIKTDLIAKLRIYASINNLATITKYSGIDPEVDVSGLAPGVDNKYRYPQARTFTFGIQASF